MEQQIAKMKVGLLDINNPIYDLIVKEPWWQLIKDDKDLYIEIRKENIVDVYYLGGRMAGIELKVRGNEKKISITAHPKYLGFEDTNDSEHYRRVKKDGRVLYVPIYSDCSELLKTHEGINILKDNIVRYYSKDKTDETTNISEKRIQGELIINNRRLYLDSEFAHRLYATEKLSVRFDLVKIVDGKIVFEELKRINDPRLRTGKGQNPEIIEQMHNYKIFIKENLEVLAEYYKELYSIKAKLQLPLPIVDVETLTVDPEPFLLIMNLYNRNLSQGKRERVDDIKKVLNDNHYKFDILNYK